MQSYAGIVAWIPAWIPARTLAQISAQISAPIVARSSAPIPALGGGGGSGRGMMGRAWIRAGGLHEPKKPCRCALITVWAAW